MAITKVIGSISNNSSELTHQSNDIYSGNLKAPNESGVYGIEIRAYDDEGNVSIVNKENMSGLELRVGNWIDPKTDWDANSDRFNIEDYNRIKNNLKYLHEYANELYVPIETEDMGEDATYPIDWDVDKFNAFERNLDEINKQIYTQDFGASQTFYPNGVFIQADELNRIESAMLSMKDVLDRQKAGIRRLKFRLGTYRGVRI